MDTNKKRILYGTLTNLVRQFEEIQDERTFLMNEAQARVAALTAERTEVLAEANLHLTRLNELLVADGQPELTLSEIRLRVRPSGGPRIVP